MRLIGVNPEAQMLDNGGELQATIETVNPLNLSPTERHICLFAREPAQLKLTLLALLRTSTVAEARVVLALNQVETRLSDLLADPGVQRLSVAGRLRPLEAAALYLSEQRFDMATVLNRLSQLTLEGGVTRQPVVVIGEISWAAQQQPGFDLARYEAGLDKLLSEQPAIALLVCIYDAYTCNGEMALAALQTHPATLIDGVCRAGLGLPKGVDRASD